MRANGMPEAWADELKGLATKVSGYIDPVEFSPAMKKLRELGMRQEQAMSVKEIADVLSRMKDCEEHDGIPIGHVVFWKTKGHISFRQGDGDAMERWTPLRAARAAKHLI